MDFELRKKALSRLARSESEAAYVTLRDELDKAITRLGKETEYDRLEEALSILEIIGDRFSSDATAALADFTAAIEKRTLTHPRAGDFAEAIGKYKNARTLIGRAIEVLLRMRYLETVPIFQVLMRLAKHEAKEVSDKAIDGLKTMAHYDLLVFYGDKSQPGIGAAPQLQIIDELERFSDESPKDIFPAVLAVSESLLSPTIEGTTWSYRTLTLSRGATPAIAGVAEVRARTIAFLRRLYNHTQSIDEKLNLIHALNDATRPSHSGAPDEKAAAMLADNTVDVLRFYGELASAESPLQLLEKIESNAYWIYHHSNRLDIETEAFRVRDALARNSEYQIYKTLIGFEGIFSEWSALRSESEIEEKDSIREAKAQEFVKSINEHNYPTWRTRILEYTKIESNDLATFPIFYKFLEQFAVTQPALAHRLLLEDAANMKSFLIPVLRGLWVGPLYQKQRQLITTWIDSGLYLRQIAAQFLVRQPLDEELLGRVLSKAIELKDELTVSTVLSVAVLNYKPQAHSLIRDFFSPALSYLTEIGSTRWILDFWFRREIRQLIPDLSPDNIQLLLMSLFLLKKIDYHAEEILYLIAALDSDLVLEFLCERIRHETTIRTNRREFEAIPYAFHKLQEPLAKNAKAAVNAVITLYDGNYGVFIYRGARLLRIIFPDFPDNLSKELLRLVGHGSERKIEIVLAVLRSYDGPKAIHEVCKAIIKAIPQESELRGEVATALQTTGVVCGEYGFAEAYERKIEELRDWLNDSDGKVQEFARWYISSLEKQLEIERKRVAEEIALRKQQHGE